ncbi:aminopeptidase P family protein [Spirillospora sp. CA-294931]|uniref:aminopeptidase P family protein n=1 Tax=Spirillospora sp. CA-294931 TaxID=3240042 RepID=UPI003D9497BE
MTREPQIGSHDQPVPAALSEFIRGGWAEPTPVDLSPAAVAQYTPGRRAALAARFPGERLVVPSGPLHIRSYDTHYEYRPHTAHTYLCGGDTPDAVLVIEPDGDAAVFVWPPARRGDSDEFFRDRTYGELWTGRRPGLDDLTALLGVPHRHRRDLAGHLKSDVTTRVLRGVDAEVDALTEPRTAAEAELESAMAELRLVKDAWEIGQLQSAVDATVLGFGDVARALADAAGHPRGERWIEGVFNLRARAEGNDVGYQTIAASGPNACVLHWTRNTGPVRPGEMILLDAGVEVETLYTADITRVLPVSGAFTPLQRELYELVHGAQRAAIDVVRPGARFEDFHQAAMGVICEGLEGLGLLPVSAEQAMAPDSQVHRRFTLHSTGHMLGMDVHDCGKARAETYRGARLQEGHVLTVEPGLYFQPDDLTVPEELRGIGIRIEDDLVVTADGSRVLSAALPSAPSDVEAWLAAR